MITFSGKSVWVTGGGRGIGRAAALQLSALGASVAVSARTEDEIEDTAEAARERGGRAEALACDVSDWQSVVETVGQIEATHGPVDALINNAGVLGPLAPAWQSPPRDWARAIDINLTGAYYCVRAVLAGMVERGSGAIVNISSGAASFAAPNWSAYAASKAGLDQFTRSLAVELKGSGVRVNSLHPGLVETEMVQTLRSAPPDELPPARRRFFEDATARGEVNDPQVAAKVIAWLASEAAAHLNGAVLDARDDPSVIQTAIAALEG